MEGLPFVVLDVLFLFDGFGEGDIDHVAVLESDHDGALLLHERLHGCAAETGSEDTVKGAWRTSALEVTKDRDACAVLGMALLNHFRYGLRTARDSMLLNEDDTAVLMFASALSDSGFELLLDRRAFGDDRGFGSGSDGGIEGKESGIASHDFDEEESLMAGACVAQFVHTFDDGVERGVIADGRVRAPEVIIDRSGHSDDGDVVFLR